MGPVLTATVISLHRFREGRVSELPASNLPVLSDPQIQPRATRIALVDLNNFTRVCIASSLSQQNPNLDVTGYALAAAVEGEYDLILYIAPDRLAHALGDLATLKERGPVVILGDGSDRDTIREVFGLGVRGYIHSATTDLDAVLTILNFVKAGGTYVPKSLIVGEAPRNPDELTDRESAVMRLVMIGKQNKVIAYEIGLSESTVKVHLRTILRKLGARNRTEAVANAKARGLDL